MAGTGTTRTIDFNGVTVEYDWALMHKWSFQRKINGGRSDPAGFYDACDELLLGRSDEVAATLSATSDEPEDALMVRLIRAIGDEPGTAKN